MYSPITLTGAGTAPVVNLTFPFLDKAHVKATVNGAAATFTWTGASQITFSAVAPGGSAVVVYRETPISSPLVDFEDTSVLTAADLDLADTQLRYHQEEVDTRVESASSSAASAADALASKNAAAASETAAANSASAAAGSASAASTSASGASSSATTATTKAGEASTSAATATTKASEASTSAATATTKASEASTSATNAANSASAASTSASEAAASAASLTTERIIDDVAAAIAAGTHSNVTITYDDPSGSLSFSAAGGGGLTDGDKGDVVVGSSGTTLTVESATPSGGTFSVTGAVSVSGAGSFGGAVTVPDVAYDGTSWDGNFTVPTKNAIRDKFESLVLGVSDGDKGDVVISGGGTTYTVESATPAGGTFSLTGSLTMSGTNFYTAATYQNPTKTTRSPGTRVVLRNTLSAANYDYAIGLDGGRIWLSTPATDYISGIWFYNNAGVHVEFRGDGETVFNGGVWVPVEAYGAGWSGDNSVPTKGEIYTQMEAKKAKNPAIQSVTSSATVTPTFSNDQVNITAQAAALALANPTGTAVDGWGIVIRIKDNGTARAISYGTNYRAMGVTLPTTTVASKTLYLGMIYNAADTKWDVVSVAQEA